MKVILILLIFIFSKTCFAQIPYTDFIQNDTAIQWAAEYDQILNITPKITRYGIRNIIHAKLMRGECIDNYTTNTDGAFKTIFCLKDTGLNNVISTSINPYGDDYNRTINHNELLAKSSEIKSSYKDYLVNNKFHIYKAKQILFYENGKLFVNNTLVTPLYLKEEIDSLENTFAWFSTYTSCFNTNFTSPTQSQKSLFIDLGNGGEKYNLHHNLSDSNPKAKVFTKLNPVFSHHLFKDILANKITVVDEKGKIILAKKVLNHHNPLIEIPMLCGGGRGEIGKSLWKRNEVNIDSFYKFSINQHFYFDSSQNVLHSEVNYIEVYKNIITSMGIDLGEAIYYRIYFIKPSQYKKLPHKKYLN
jgi:hypothetical protein